MLVQLIYISAIVDDSIDRMREFISTTRENNSKNSITSIILSFDRHYLHCIEGERNAVSELFADVSHNSHHSLCTIVRFNEVSRREFPDFSTEISNFSDFATNGVNTICPIDVANTDTISSASAMSLLRRVAAHTRAERT